jgi:hypothetical protein
MRTFMDTPGMPGRAANPEDQEAVHLLPVEQFNAARHDELVQRGSRLSLLDIVECFLFYTSGCIGIVFLLTVHAYFAPGGRFPLWLWTVFIYLIAGTAFPMMLLHVRTLRSAVLRHHGSHSFAYYLRMRRQMDAALLISLVIGAYVLAVVSSSPPFTPAMLRLDEPGGNPCAVVANTTGYAANTSYIKQHCHPSSDVLQPDAALVCHDGGFAEYASAYSACTAARAYFATTTRAYAAFSLWFNLASMQLFSFFQDSTPAHQALRFPRVRHAATVVMMATYAVCCPVLLAVLLSPALSPNWLTGLIFHVYALLANVGFIVAGFGIYSFESFAARFDALLTGRDLEIALAGGRRRRVHAELVRLLSET